jgi:ProP effector
LLQWLAARWPATFDPVQPPRPMKIGIHRDIAAAMPGLDAKLLSSALRLHTGRPAYAEQLLEAGTVRFDLDGNPAGEVTEAQVEALKAARRAEAKRRHRRYRQREEQTARQLR